MFCKITPNLSNTCKFKSSGEIESAHEFEVDGENENE